MEITNNEVINTENIEVQEAVVEPQTEPVEPEQVADEQPKVQTREQNRQQAQMRRSRENDLQQQLEAARANESRLMEALKGYGYTGNAEEVAAQIHAAQQGIPYEEYQRQQEQEKARLREMMQADPEFRDVKQKADLYEQQVVEGMMKDDLAAIKKAFPDVKAKSVAEFGNDYLKLIAVGIDAVTAYAAVQKGEEAAKKPVPPVMGAVNQTPAEKDFYTSEEVTNIEKNHPEMLKDPKIMDRIMKSMSRWK